MRLHRGGLRWVCVPFVALLLSLASPSRGQELARASYADLPAHLKLESIDPAAGEPGGPQSPPGLLGRTFEPLTSNPAARFFSGCWKGQELGGWRDWLPLALSAGTVAALQLGARPPKEARWSRRNGLDGGVRAVLKGGSRDTRVASDDASDAIFYSLAAASLFDIFHLCHRKEGGEQQASSPYDFWRMVSTDLAVFFMNQGATRIAKVSAGRERPYVRPCLGNPAYLPECDRGRPRNASFYSGHASNSMTLASLICTRHLNRPGSGGWDVTLCGTAVAASVATGILRITAEKHFATDVLMGWASGALFGGYVAYKLNYAHSDPAQPPKTTFVPMIGPDLYGLSLSYRF